MHCSRNSHWDSCRKLTATNRLYLCVGETGTESLNEGSLFGGPSPEYQSTSRERRRLFRKKAAE
jgi:hypothetical protein